MLDLKVIAFSHNADDASETTADSGTVKFLADVSKIHTYRSIDDSFQLTASLLHIS